ncbi:aldo/keto reductase [Pseudorhodoferax sp.]|uniref:aldo/keto reductase n=1 Tax=Pseudorhodoferax sp. TaxID=1993553 RepID=UPI002DD677D7|nr:aldo/keto reductase [Pseudorhodoferax sp.]
MPDPTPTWPTRRRLLAAAAGVLPAAWPGPARAQPTPLQRPLPSTRELLPVIGLGSWITFNVGADPAGRAAALAVMRAFFAAGGTVVDSSPMYGSSQDVIGDALARLQPARLFAADKVWTRGAARGDEQIAASARRWRLQRPFDLLQVHNLLDWETQLPRLFEMKAAGRLRLVGITTSEGRRHRDIEALMQRHPLDFVQFSYNLLDREAEQRLLPLAAERGIAVLVNRPFRQGELLRQLARHPLPPWAADIGCRHWAQVALKFVVSHPAVTCVIPATSQVEHLQQNMQAAHGLLPDAALRRRMAAHVAAL